MLKWPDWGPALQNGDGRTRYGWSRTKRIADREIEEDTRKNESVFALGSAAAYETRFHPPEVAADEDTYLRFSSAATAFFQPSIFQLIANSGWPIVATAPDVHDVFCLQAPSPDPNRTVLAASFESPLTFDLGWTSR